MGRTRRAHGTAARLGALVVHEERPFDVLARPEARRLAWSDVDLDKGIVSLDENKTDRPRSWVLNAGVALVLAKWRENLKPLAGGRFLRRSGERRGSAIRDRTRTHESRRTWGNREGREAVLEAAIERVTRALVTAADEVIPELVAERRAMREELDGLGRGENVVPFPVPRGKRPGRMPRQ